jgi:8-oxo-dGTP pyrophosphatase MutT (NUDIX family)
MSKTLFLRLQGELQLDVDHTDAIAAVLVLISQSNQPGILYTRRATHLRSHPGEICFPGGMREPGDENLWMTALRETYEEVGLPANQIQLLGNLPASRTGAGTWVVPFVAAFNPEYPLVPALDELDTIFQVPLEEFKTGIKIRDDYFERHGENYRLPVYQYQQHEIWGFTAGVTERLLKILLPG